MVGQPMSRVMKLLDHPTFQVPPGLSQELKLWTQGFRLSAAERFLQTTIRVRRPPNRILFPVQMGPTVRAEVVMMSRLNLVETSVT
jgi:hypothetical protein